MEEIVKSYKDENFDNLQKIIMDYTTLISSVMGYLNKSSAFKYQVILFNYLERFYYSFKSLLCLMPSYKRTFNYKFPIGVIARVLVLDFITIIYLLQYLKFSKEDLSPFEDEFIEQTNKIDHGFFVMVDNTLKGNVDDGIIDENERQKILRIYFDNFSSFFKEENGLLSVKKGSYLKPIEMYRSIKKGEFKQWAGAYFLYSFYSQYEHASSMTKNMVYNNHNLDFHQLIKTISYVLEGTYVMFRCMKIEKAFEDSLALIIENFNKDFRNDKYLICETLLLRSSL